MEISLRLNSRYRVLSRPTYGRVVHKEPIKPFREVPVGRTRSYNYKDISRLYGKTENTHNRPWAGAAAVSATSAIGNTGSGTAIGTQSQSPRRRIQFRFAGGMASNSMNGQNALLTPQKGSFQRLKELIWTERARELAQQRKTEEMIARAAVLKEIANGQRYAFRAQLYWLEAKAKKCRYGTYATLRLTN